MSTSCATASRHLEPADAGSCCRTRSRPSPSSTKQGLIALVQLLRGDQRGGELLYEAVEQPEVMALFVSHGIIRTDRTIDVLRVVEQIRPYLVTSSIEMDVESVAATWPTCGSPRAAARRTRRPGTRSWA